MYVEVANFALNWLDTIEQIGELAFDIATN